MAALEWDAPADNNSTITAYNIYLSSRRLSTKQTLTPSVDDKSPETFEKIATTTGEKYYDVMGLEAETVYYFMITAENQLGEGYKSKTPFFVHTPQAQVLHTLYTWGNNTSSELALSDEQLATLDKDIHIKSSVRRVVKNQSFEQGGVMLVAPGNASSIVLYVDKNTKSQSLL